MKTQAARTRFAAIVALAILPGSVVYADLSAPDEWESAPYDDDARTTTQNWLPTDNGPVQAHTLSAADDEDWIQVHEGGLPQITIGNIVCPVGVQLRVSVFDSTGTMIQDQITQAPYAPSTSFTLGWIGVGNRVVTIRVRACDDATENCDPMTALSEPISYEISFGQAAGPNNGLTGGTGFGTVDLRWGTESLAGGGRQSVTPVGFDVLRQRLDEVVYTQVNLATIPLPGTFGPCNVPTDSGCVSFTDSTVVQGYWYTYTVSLRNNDNSTTPYISTPTGFYVPIIPASVHEWQMMD